MDAKSLAKSKRAHSLHHKKHHPNQKPKAATATSSVGVSGTNKAPAVKEKPLLSQGRGALPSNWDRYEDEDDSVTESQTGGYSSQPGNIVVPKSKGADYSYLLSEARSQNSTSLSSGFFPSLDDFVSDFGQGKDSFFAVRGESLLSSIQNDSFFVEDKTSASYESSFLSLNLNDLSEQLAKIDLPARLFMEAELFPSEMFSERSEECQNSSQSVDNANRNDVQACHRDKVTPPNATKSHNLVIQDHTGSTTMSPMVQPNENQSKLKAEIAETELDMLLESFADANLKENTSAFASTLKEKTIDFDIDGTLDDLLKETSTPSLIDQNSASPTYEVKSNPLGSKSELLDDFDSWLDTI